MASSKLADLTATTTLADVDLAYVTRDPSGTPVDRKITVANLKLALRRTIQVVSTVDVSMQTGTTTIPADDTIPQNTEGTQFMSVTITPTNASNILKIDVIAHVSCGTGTRNICVALFQDTTANALACGDYAEGHAGFICPAVFTYVMTAGTTSATTFKVRAGVETSGTVTFNGSAGARIYGGVLASSIVVTELAA